MNILETVEDFLTKRGRLLLGSDFSAEDAPNRGGEVRLGEGAESVRIKISMSADNLLRFRAVLPIKPNPARVNELLVAVNALNSQINFGKFIITGEYICFEITRICTAPTLKDADIAYAITAVKTTATTHAPMLASLNDKSITLSQFLTGSNPRER